VPQVGTNAEQRQDNVAGAFALALGHTLPTGGRLVVIDDVRTTGATLGACASALVSAKPSWLGALTVAWAMPASCHGRWARLNGLDGHHPAI
jgi:predicted amidophosphoribosyltransferase